MKPKPNSAEDLHSRGQRTSLDLAVEMLHHVQDVNHGFPGACRYCLSEASLVDDARWLVEREAARAVALDRTTELEQLVVRGEATEADRAEYRTIRASGHLDGSDELLIQLRLISNRTAELDALRRERDELKARLAEYEPESEEMRDESRQRRLDEAQAQLPAGWDLAQDADHDGRYHVHHELWPAAPVYLRLSDDPPWRSWWECGAIVTSGRFDGLVNTSLGNYRDLVALLRPGGPTPARAGATRDWSGVSLKSDEADLIREILVDWYSWVDARQPMGTHWAGVELNGSRRVDLMHAVAVKFKLLGGGGV